jgi:t-SNARE complex subunit (syntaxin)
MDEADVLEQIQWEIISLKDSMQILNEMVVEQQPYLDTMEDVILASKQDVQVAANTVAVAQTYQSSWYYYTAGLVMSVGTTVALLLLL